MDKKTNDLLRKFNSKMLKIERKKKLEKIKKK